MEFASDNGAGVPGPILDALIAANDGHAPSYGSDRPSARVVDLLRDRFDAPHAEIRLVGTGTAANALALAVLTPPWGTIWCHRLAHVTVDECGAPEFYTGGAKLVHLDGPHATIEPQLLDEALTRARRDVHSTQPAALSLSNLTECGAAYDPGTLGALCTVAHAHGLGVHLDGARLANALVATGATPAEMTWQAGVDVLCLGGTKNGLLAAEAVILFDPARAAEFDLRRKRAGHLVSKHRYLAAQFDAWLHDDLWLDLARRANVAAAQLAAGLEAVAGVRILHPVAGNMIFVDWPEALAQHLRSAGARFHSGLSQSGDARSTARLVTSWNTPDAAIRQFLECCAGHRG